VRRALPVCRCGRPALVGGWISTGPHVARWGCSGCAGVEHAHPFVSRPAVPAADAHPTSRPADLAENNLARTDRVQLRLDLRGPDGRPAL
jgi:hypothetical protein